MDRRSFIRKASFLVGASALTIREAFSFSVESIKSIFPSLHFSNSREYESLKKIFNTFVQKADPKAILQSEDPNEISLLVKSSSLVTEPILMRSGGHSYAAFSTGSGIVLDSRKLDRIKNRDNGLVTISSGVNLERAQRILSQSNLTFASGEFPGVGIAGYLLGGGHSRRSSLLGIGADSVHSMDVILASGDRVKNISENHYGDLYWAMLGGGGGNFAFVENFHIEPVSEFKDYFFKFTFNLSQMGQAEDIFNLWEQSCVQTPNHISMNLTLYIESGTVFKLILSGLYMDTLKTVEEMNRELFSGAWGNFDQFEYKKFYSEVKSSNHIKSTRLQDMAFKGSSHYADHLIGKEGFRDILVSIKKNTKKMSMYMGFYAMGGKIHNAPRDISYPHRSAKYMVDIFSNFKEDRSRFQEFSQKFDNHYKDLDSLFSGRAYVNYPNLDFQDWSNRYYGDSLERLLAVKKKYDRHNRFNFGDQSLGSLL